MSAAPIVLTDLRVRAIDQAPHQKNEMPTRARPGGTPALRVITDIGMAGTAHNKRAPKRSADFNVVRCGIANRSTAQK